MAGEAPSADQVRAALDRILKSTAFSGARRPGDMLHYVVEAALKTPDRTIKEQELGAAALGRGDKFDPRFDPIARVEASRLRTRLRQYYAGEGAADPVQISVPPGGYSPAFVFAPPAAPEAATGPVHWSRRPAAWFAAGAAASAFVATLALVLMPPAPITDERRPPKIFDAAIGAPGVLSDAVGNSIALSPDGSTLVMNVLLPDGTTRLFSRKLEAVDSLGATEIPGTTGAFDPFISPDGRWVGFGSGGKIRKALIDGGGSPVAISDTADYQRLDWADDGHIISTVNSENAIYRTPETGGELTRLFGNPASEGVLSWPQALPKGRGVVFTVIDRARGETRIEAARLDGGERTVLARSGIYPRYVKAGGSGYILYVDRGTLFAVPFDVNSFDVRGEPRPLVRDVAYREGLGYAFYDVSQDGMLVYVRSPDRGLSVMRWLDGGDRQRPLLDEPGRYYFPRVSPDGRRLAYAAADGPVVGLWTADLMSGKRAQLTTGSASEAEPAWSPDSRGVFFAMNAAALGWRAADGGGPARVLSTGFKQPWSVSPDGKRLTFHTMAADTHFDIWTAPIVSGPDGPTAIGEPEVFLQTPAVELAASFSPDGKWVAYHSNESGTFEIYVRAFPDTGRRIKVSSAGGRLARWSPAAPEIFYVTGDNQVMVAPYAVRNGELAPETPRPWSRHRLADTGVFANYDVAADGKSVVAVVPNSTGAYRPRDHVTIVTNLAEMLRKP